MSENTDLLRVAPPRERNSATNRVFAQQHPATTNATATLKALARMALERNTCRNKAQQVSATSATKPPPKNTHLLCSVAMVPDGQPDPLRWPRFVALCVGDGVTETEVQAMFREQDIDDLCLSPDDTLSKMAATLVRAIKCNPDRRCQPVTQSPTCTERHRCGRCQHYSFNPNTGSTGLGWCNVRKDVSMAVPSRLIECDQFKDD